MGTFPKTLSHVAVEGWSDFANGAIHPVVNPAQLLVVTGLALLVGRQEPLRIRGPLQVFAISAAAALGLTVAGVGGAVYQPVLIAIALCLGLSVAIGKAMRPLAVTCLCSLSAVALGLDSGVESGGWAGKLQTLFGTWLSLCLLVLYVALATSNATGKPWAVAAVRIAGSWLVAISLMVLAFALKK